MHPFQWRPIKRYQSLDKSLDTYSYATRSMTDINNQTRQFIYQYFPFNVYNLNNQIVFLGVIYINLFMFAMFRILRNQRASLLYKDSCALKAHKIKYMAVKRLVICNYFRCTCFGAKLSENILNFILSIFRPIDSTSV